MTFINKIRIKVTNQEFRITKNNELDSGFDLKADIKDSLSINPG